MSKEAEICGDNAGCINGECIVLKVYLHCQNCSKSVVKCLKQFPGVEEVMTDVENDMVIVKGKGVDSKALAEKLEKKCKKHVDIISPQLELEQVCNDVEIIQPPTIQDEVTIIHVVLKVSIHCQNCGVFFKERLLEMKGVRKVEVDEEKSQVKVEGVFEAKELVEYVHLRMGRQATIIINDTPPCTTATTIVVDEDENAPKMIKICNCCCCWEMFHPPPPPPYYAGGFYHASQVLLLSDECTHSCSIM